MIRRILDKDIEMAIKFCFDIYVESTDFRKFRSNYDLFLKSYIDIAIKYMNENNTIYYGYYIADSLVGVIEINGNYINQLVVKKEYRFGKIGTKLVEFIEEGLDNIEVNAFIGSLPFYEKLGFVSVYEDENKKESIKMQKCKKDIKRKKDV